MSGSGRSGLGRAVSCDANHGIFNSAGNSSGPSIGASSQVTDGNSSFSGGRQLPSSSSINDEPYNHFPASPMSSSNNISGSSVMDGPSNIQQSPQNEHTPRQASLSHTYQSMLQDAGMMPVHKRPRLAGDSGEQQAMQQMLQRHQSLQLQAIAQPQRLQTMQSLPHLQRLQIHQQPQMAMPAPLQLVSPARPPFESGLCARRLMQYMYHQSHRPAENPILYWRKFVVEYFAPRAKKRWCFSMYNTAGNHAFGAFPHASMDAWQCGICGSKTGKGFEATYEVIPRLDQIKFDHGVIDELLYLDMPHESRLPSGMMVLEYAKAVQESVHEQCRVVREGQLRIIFTPDLKILFWEFCARRHEELLPRRLLVHQVNQLLHAAHKYQSAVNEKMPSAVPVQDLQASCNMFVAASRQLARNVEMPLLNDLGFPKRYVRCLQISEVVNCMKDLIDFSKFHKMGPLESLKHYTQQVSIKLHSQKMKTAELTDASQNLLSDPNSLNKFMAMHPGTGRLPGNSLPSPSFLNNSSSANVPATHQLLRNSSNITNINPLQHPYAPLIATGRLPHHAPTKSQLPPPANNAEHLPEILNAKGTVPGKACVKIEIGSAKGNNDTSKPDATNNGLCASGDCYDTKEEVLDSLNIVDFDQDLLGELLNEIDW